MYLIGMCAVEGWTHNLSSVRTHALQTEPQGAGAAAPELARIWCVASSRAPTPAQAAARVLPPSAGLCAGSGAVQLDAVAVLRGGL